MKAAAAALIVAVLCVLHQDVWFWTDVRPLVFGILPIGLFYHSAYTVASSLALVGLVRLLWPSHLELEAEDGRPGATGDSPAGSR
jgi:hypothetical protein